MKTMCAALLLLHSLLLAVESAAEPVFTFPAWKESRKLNDKLLESEAHNAYFDIYLNDLAFDTYKNATAPYPVGSIVYKPLYRYADHSLCVRLVVMVKMEPGYDSENNDWWYGVYDRTGTQAWHTGRIPECIACHAYAKATDYMFSESIRYRMQHPHSTTTTTGELLMVDP